jgi:hypothetical protein
MNKMHQNIIRSIAALAPSLFFLSMTGFSQENVLSIGPRAGVNIANVSNVDGSKSSVGLVAGLTGTYSISQTSGVTMDVLYSQEGYALDAQDVDLTYLQVPLYYNLFLGELGDRLRPKVYIGVAPGFLLDAKSGNGDLTESMSSVVFSVTGGAGINYRIADRVWLNADVRAFLGLNDLREDAFQTDETVAARNVQLSVGVAFGLSRLD